MLNTVGEPRWWLHGSPVEREVRAGFIGVTHPYCTLAPEGDRLGPLLLALLHCSVLLWEEVLLQVSDNAQLTCGVCTRQAWVSAAQVQ